MPLRTIPFISLPWKLITYGFMMLSIFLFFLSSCSHKKHGEADNVFYTCSMDPQVMEKKPGKCPICKMELTRTVIAPDQDKGSIRLSETQMKLGNIRTEKVASGSIGEGIHLRGMVVPDERKVEVISSRVPGRVDKLYFKNIGEPVRAGDRIYDIYSEELQAGIRQYLLLKEKAKQLSGGNVNYKEMMISARNKLLVWGLSESQISRMDQNAASSLVPFYSKAAGVVSEVMTGEGDYVNEGGAILKVADYAAVWVEAEAYPQHMGAIHQGLKVNITPEGFPEEVIEGTISFINPEVKPQSRISLVRIEIPNRDGKYKPGMRVTVNVLLKETHAIAIPEEAVLYQPGMNTVWVLNEKGAFTPRMVETGMSSNGKTEIRSGLREGETIAVSGVYLIDSEYQIKKGSGAGMEGMDHGGKENNAGAPHHHH